MRPFSKTLLRATATGFGLAVGAAAIACADSIMAQGTGSALSSYQIVIDSVNIAAANGAPNPVVIAACPAGLKILGGGYKVGQITNVGLVQVRVARPLADAGSGNAGFKVVVQNPTDSVIVVATAVCAA